MTKKSIKASVHGQKVLNLLKEGFKPKEIADLTGYSIDYVKNVNAVFADEFKKQKQVESEKNRKQREINRKLNEGQPRGYFPLVHHYGSKHGG